MRKFAPIAPLAGATVAVLAFGGTEPISLSLVELVLFAAGVALLLGPQAALTRYTPRIWIVPGILLSVALLQLLPLVPSHEGTRALSASPAATLQFLLLMAAAACALFLTMAGAHDLTGQER